MTAQATTPSESNPTNRQTIRAAFEKSLPRIRDLFVHAIAQVRILRKAYPGTMHFLIFWGVAIQVVGTIINILKICCYSSPG